MQHDGGRPAQCMCFQADKFGLYDCSPCLATQPSPPPPPCPAGTPGTRGSRCAFHEMERRWSRRWAQSWWRSSMRWQSARGHRGLHAPSARPGRLPPAQLARQQAGTVAASCALYHASCHLGCEAGQGPCQVQAAALDTDLVCSAASRDWGKLHLAAAAVCLMAAAAVFLLEAERCCAPAHTTLWLHFCLERSQILNINLLQAFRGCRPLA